MPRFLALLLLAPALFAAEPQVPIVAYHQVEAVPTAGWSVSVEDFTDQMRFLQAAGYHVIPIAAFYDYLAGKVASLPANPVVITADDGFGDQDSNLNRVITQFGFPWSLFVYPRFIDTHGATAITWPQVQQLVASGVDVESHTMTHPHLMRKSHAGMSDAQYAEWLHSELADSKRVIEERTGKPVRFLCYPYGDWDAGVEAEARRDGYLAALTSWAGFNDRATNPFELHRSLVMSDTTLSAFAEAVGALPLAVRNASPANDGVGKPAVVSAVIADPRDLDPSTIRIALLGQPGRAKYDAASGRVSVTVTKFTRAQQHVVVYGERASDHRIVAAAWTFYTSAAARQQYQSIARRLRELPLHHTETKQQ